MPQVDVLGYLNSKGLNMKRAGGWEFHTACPIHGEDPGKRGRFYINVDPDAEVPGLYYCHSCGESGNLVTLKKFFGDTATPAEEQSYETFEIFKLAARFYEKELRKHPDVLEWLGGEQRVLSDETIKNFHLGYAPQEIEQNVATGETKRVPTRVLYRYLRDLDYTPKEILASGLCTELERGGKKIIVDQLHGMVTIPYVVAGNVVDIRGRTWPEREGAGKYKTCSGRDARIFNTDAFWDTEEVYCTEGEFDAMVLTQLGISNVVAFPGAKSWQDSWNTYFSPLRRVWVVFDNDEKGDQGAEKVISKLGAKARRVRLSEPHLRSDPTEWVAQGGTRLAFDEIMATARKGNLLITVQEAIQEFETVQAQPGLKFGWDYLDAMIDPGLQASQLFVLLAKTGTGKTLLMLNMMDNMRRVPGQEDLKFLFVSLEQTRGEWWDRARRIYRFHNMDEDDDTAAYNWWRDNIYLIDKNRLSEEELAVAVEDFREQQGQKPDLIVIDYLGYWAAGFKGERYERTSDAVMSMKAFCKEQGTPIITPHQVSRNARDGEEFSSDAARDSGAIEETADFMLNVWTPDNLLARSEEEKTGALHARLAKSRHGGRGLLVKLQFAPLSLAMLPETSPLCAAARREVAWRRDYSDNWQKALYRHRTGYMGHLDKVPDLHEQTDMDEAFAEVASEMESRRYPT